MTVVECSDDVEQEAGNFGCASKIIGIGFKTNIFTGFVFIKDIWAADNRGIGIKSVGHEVAEIGLERMRGQGNNRTKAVAPDGAVSRFQSDDEGFVIRGLTEAMPAISPLRGDWTAFEVMAS